MPSIVDMNLTFFSSKRVLVSLHFISNIKLLAFQYSLASESFKARNVPMFLYFRLYEQLIEMSFSVNMNSFITSVNGIVDLSVIPF